MKTFFDDDFELDREIVMSGENSLYEQLGGSDSVDAAVDLFYMNVLGDAQLAPFFENTDMDRQKVHQKTFLTKALGGASIYQGRGLKLAHGGLGISDANFDRIADHPVGDPHRIKGQGRPW